MPERLGEFVRYRRISEAPPNDSAVCIVPSMTALGLNTVPVVEVVHGVYSLAETTGRDGDFDEVGESLPDGFGAQSTFVTAHSFFSGS
jgi:hypothetical protein